MLTPRPSAADSPGVCSSPCLSIQALSSSCHLHARPSCSISLRSSTTRAVSFFVVFYVYMVGCMAGQPSLHRASDCPTRPSIRIVEFLPAFCVPFVCSAPFPTFWQRITTASLSSGFRYFFFLCFHSPVFVVLDAAVCCPLLCHCAFALPLLLLSPPISSAIAAHGGRAASADIAGRRACCVEQVRPEGPNGCTFSFFPGAPRPDLSFVRRCCTIVCHAWSTGHEAVFCHYFCLIVLMRRRHGVVLCGVGACYLLYLGAD